MPDQSNDVALRTVELGALFNRISVFLDVVNAIDKKAYAGLMEAANLDEVENLLEIGCGRGHLAKKILQSHSNISRYIATEASVENIKASEARLNGYPSFKCEFVDGLLPYRFPNDHFDVIVSCYVLDCMDENRFRQEIEELKRILCSNGRLCLLSVAKGETPISYVVSSFWSLLYSVSPRLTGGSRVANLAVKVGSDWEDVSSQTIVCYGFPSELTVARKA